MHRRRPACVLKLLERLARRRANLDGRARTAFGTDGSQRLRHEVVDRTVRHRHHADAPAAGDQRGDADGDWLDVTDTLQRRLLADTGGVAPERMAAALFALRAAGELFPSLAPLSLYRRHNRAAVGTLREGDAPPDVPLYLAADGAPTSLHAACATDGRPSLVVAGSWT